jgi:WD40 repeat protein
LEITRPNGGEVFLAGSDTVITWTGIPESDTVSLEYSIDGGSNWKLITDSASGLKYRWTNLPKPETTNCKIKATQREINDDDSEPGTLQHTLVGHTESVIHISWSPDGSRVATSSYDSTGIIWDSASGTRLHTLAGHLDDVIHISWSLDGSRVATASKDNTGIIWDSASGTRLHTLAGHLDDVLHISWSPDGSRVATANYDGTGIIWDATSGTRLHTLAGHTEWVWHINWSPDGSRVATASFDGTGIIWDATSGTKLHTLNGHTFWVNQISWSPDGSRVATSSYDSTGIIWDSASGTRLHTLAGHLDDVLHISWSPDGSRVATASKDSTGIIWDATSGTRLHTLAGHTYWVAHISWSPDGSRVATASYDSTCIIWDATNGIRLFTLAGHTDVVGQISWCPDGSRVATVSRDKTAKVWFVEKSYSILQEDESEIFSIAEPIAKAKNIDMGKCLLGRSIEKFEQDFITNPGTWKFSVDSIFFTGADVLAFSQEAGQPNYELEPGATHFGEFSFSPLRVGVHSAEIVIITQSDTLTQQITGEGIEPLLQVQDGILDFGEVEVGDFSTISDTVLLRNIGTQSVNITKTEKMYPDTEQFNIISGGGAFTLNPGEERQLTLEFRPFYGGRTSGRIGFEYDGVGSPATVQLFGTGTGDISNISEGSAYGGTRLINPNSQAGILAIAPNPASNKITFEISISENGLTELGIYNLMGEKVRTIFSENAAEFGKKEIDADISALSSGHYIVVFKTPTYIESRQISIIK